MAKKSADKEKFEKLLQANRQKPEERKKDPWDCRNQFDRDHWRIVVSPYFRRLQDKTQVFPLEENDFVRTRLTHSIEASVLARSLGMSAEKFLIDQHYLSKDFLGYIPSILTSSALVHDIGNPPFGHFGEATIREFFMDIKNNEQGINEDVHDAFVGLENSQKADFLNFDGNVQGFRILTRLHDYNLTYPVLATMIKYPYSSMDGNKSGGKHKHSQKKFGYFQAEQDVYNNIWKTLGLPANQRHPLTYLLEAADDIAFSISDIEDGYKMGIIDLGVILKVFDTKELKEIFPGAKRVAKQFVDDNRMDKLITFLREKGQAQMLIETCKTFNAKFQDILHGKFDEDLILASDARPIRQAFKELGNINFQNKEVLKTELLGQKVIRYMLELFTDALFSDNLKKPGTKESKLYALISDHCRWVAGETKDTLPSDPYKKFMLITDYISGMTDTYALQRYKELTGVE